MIAMAEDERKTNMAKELNGFTPAQLVALAKLIADDSKQAKEAREQLKAGVTYPLDFIVHISGNMEVGRDNICPCQFRLPVKQIIAKLASKLNGVTVDSVLEELVADIKVGREIDVEPVERAIKAAESLMDITRENRKGKITLDVVANLGIEQEADHEVEH